MAVKQDHPAALSAWLHRSLHERYAPVLKEPLPQEWLDLLRTRDGE